MTVLLLLKKKLVLVKQLFVDVFVIRNTLPGKSLTEVKHGYTKVCIEGQEFESINAVVEAGLAKDRFTVMRRLKSTQNKWKNWICINKQ